MPCFLSIPVRIHLHNRKILGSHGICITSIYLMPKVGVYIMKCEMCGSSQVSFTLSVYAGTKFFITLFNKRGEWEKGEGND